MKSIAYFLAGILFSTPIFATTTTNIDANANLEITLKPGEPWEPHNSSNYNVTISCETKLKPKRAKIDVEFRVLEGSATINTHKLLPGETFKLSLSDGSVFTVTGAAKTKANVVNLGEYIAKAACEAHVER